MTTEQLILTHLAAVLGGVGSAYVWLVHIVGYVHPWVSKFEAALAKLESRTVSATAAPVQAPVGQVGPTSTPPGPTTQPAP